MTPVSAANRRNSMRMARGGEPVVDGGADPSALNGRIARAMVARDQQDHAVPGTDGLLERPVDGTPRGIEVHAVEVDDAVRLDRP